MGSFKKEFVGDSYEGLSDKIQTKTFDTIITEFGKPNLVKIDVEGFEDKVINGLSISLDNCIFFIEVREETKSVVYNYFQKNGFQCICIKETNIKVNSLDDIPSFANLIFKK